MNGRMYDPVVGRFLSADPIVQDPTLTQNYNRYSYCLNNPLKYADPSGYRMAAVEEYRNLDKDITNFDRFYGYSPIGGAGGAGGGWGGNGGVLPGGYVPKINFGDQLYNAANQLLGKINEDEWYSLTNVDYANGSLEFTFGRNEIATQYMKQIADYALRRAENAASNIGYGRSYNPDEEVSSNGGVDFEVYSKTGFGASIHPEFLGIQLGVTADIWSNKRSMVFNGNGFTMSHSKISSLSISLFLIGFSMEYNYTKSEFSGEFSILHMVIGTAGYSERISSGDYGFIGQGGYKIDLIPFYGSPNYERPVIPIDNTRVVIPYKIFK